MWQKAIRLIFTKPPHIVLIRHAFAYSAYKVLRLYGANRTHRARAYYNTLFSLFSTRTAHTQKTLKSKQIDIRHRITKTRARRMCYIIFARVQIRVCVCVFGMRVHTRLGR